MANTVSRRVHSATTWSIVLSVLMIAAGVLAIALPVAASFAVTLVVGWLLVFSGIVHLVYAWRSHTTSAVIWEVLVGIVYGVIGFYLVTRPVVGLASLTLALGIYLLVEAILEFVLSYQLRPVAGTGWLIFHGIVTLVLAIMILVIWPSGSAWVLGTLVGINMLFSGVARLMISLAVRRVVV